MFVLKFSGIPDSEMLYFPIQNGITRFFCENV